MKDLLIRFLLGGVVVSLFAMVGDIFRPKSFAGLFGAAPSIALATVGLTIAHQGRSYAAVEARSMVLGGVAFFLYASLVSWILMRYKARTLTTTVALLPVWLAVSGGLLVLFARHG